MMLGTTNIKYYALFACIQFNVYRRIMLVFLTINPQVYTCKLLAGYSWNFVLEAHTKIVGSFPFLWRIHVTAVYIHYGVTESQEHCKCRGLKNACGKCTLVQIALHVCCRMRVNKNYITWRQIYRVIHKSLRDFRTRLRNNQDRHGRKEHINS